MLLKIKNLNVFWGSLKNPTFRGEGGGGFRKNQIDQIEGGIVTQYPNAHYGLTPSSTWSPEAAC